MSEEELKKLKQEIKREILNEMTRKELVKHNAWKTIRKEFEKMFYSKGYIDRREQCRIFDAIATITRISLGYNQVQIIPAERAEDIRNIMYKVLNIFPDKTKEVNWYGRNRKRVNRNYKRAVKRV